MAHISQRFRSDYQEFQLIETTTRKILKSVESFESDLGIIYLDEDNDHILERSFQHMDLTFTPLGEFETKIFLGRQHSLAHKKIPQSQRFRGIPTGPLSSRKLWNPF